MVLYKNLILLKVSITNYLNKLNSYNNDSEHVCMLRLQRFF